MILIPIFVSCNNLILNLIIMLFNVFGSVSHVTLDYIMLAIRDKKTKFNVVRNICLALVSFAKNYGIKKEGGGTT